MALTKNVNGKVIALSPLEEAAERARWAMNDSLAQCPMSATREQEHDWLIEHGLEYVREKRLDHAVAFAKWDENHRLIANAYNEALKAYNDSVVK